MIGRFVSIIWDGEDNPEGNVQPVGEHGLEPADLEFVVENFETETEML